MANCGLCDREMLSAEGCVEHHVMLDDGTVLPSPLHSNEGSLHESDKRCHDCGAEPGGVHHAHCDSARQPDGSQILIEAACYFDPDTDTDPRTAESDFVFLGIAVETEHGPREPVAAFDSLDAAEAFTENEDWCEFDIRALQLRSEYTP